jgi:hypothetical protein
MDDDLLFSTTILLLQLLLYWSMIPSPSRIEDCFLLLSTRFIFFLPFLLEGIIIAVVVVVVS